MARFLIRWRGDPVALALRKMTPYEGEKWFEMLFRTIEDLMKNGEIEDFSFFLDPSEGGYAIVKGDTKDVFRITRSLPPMFHCKVHEIIPYEKGKEIMKIIVETAKKEISQT